MVTSTGEPGRIAVDAMGGDLGPAEVVEAVKLALRKNQEISAITLVGDNAVLAPLLVQAGLDDPSKVSIHHASEVITMDDSPMVGLKRKKDSSMVRAIELVKDGRAGVVVSCGNTGALMATGTIKLRTMEGVARPALAAIAPREGGYFVLIDAGANPEAKPEHLLHNAILGSHYARLMLGIARPRVGLMTIGTEEGKGNALITETHTLLKGAADIINYIGPIEGFHVFSEHVDVVVCDGFVGNIMLKSWESLVRFFTTMLKEELTANPMRSAGAILSKGAFSALKERVNPERYGSAPLLGLRGNILKAHGSANRNSIRSAILAANQIITGNLNQLIETDIARANALMSVQPAV